MKHLNKIISVLLVICMMIPMLPELGLKLDAATYSVTVTLNPNGGTVNGVSTYTYSNVSTGTAKQWQDIIGKNYRTPVNGDRKFLYWECTACGYRVVMAEKLQTVHMDCSNFLNTTLIARYTNTANYYTVTFKPSSGTFVNRGIGYYCVPASLTANRVYYIDVGVKVADAIPHNDLKITYAKNDVFSGWVMCTGDNTTVNWYDEDTGKPYDIYHTDIRNHSSAGTFYFMAKFIDRENYMIFNATLGNFDKFTPSTPNGIEYGIKVDSKNLKYPVAIDDIKNNVTGGDQGVEYYNMLFLDFEPGRIPTPEATGFTFLGFWYGTKSGSNRYCWTPTTATVGYPWDDPNDNSLMNNGTMLTECYALAKDGSPKVAAEGTAHAYWRCNNSGATTRVAYAAPTCTTAGSETLRCTNCYNNSSNSAYIENYHPDVTKTIAATGHSYAAATCTKPQTCTKCGATTGSALGHASVTDAAVAATCTTAGKTQGAHCSRCNAVLTAQQTVPATGHNYDSGVITTQPTCLNAGVKTFTCQNNTAHTYTEAVSAKGHTAGSAKQENYVAPTCTTEGSYDMVTRCTVCNAVITSVPNTVAAKGHAYRAATYVWSDDCSTCTATSICANDASHILTKTVNTTSATTDPTCTTEGTTVYTAEFSIEGAQTQTKSVTLPIDKENHTDLVQVEAKDPTCYEIGWEAYEKCDACGYTTYTEISKLEHEMTDEVTQKADCENNGVRTYTCIRECGYSYTETIAARKHDMGEWFTVDEPTCTVEGLKQRDCLNTTETDEYYACDHCETAPLSVLPHTPVTDDETAPDCTNPGLTEGSHCEVCGKELTAQEVVDALGHDWTDVETAYTWADDKSTCTSTRVCNREGCEYTEEETVKVVVTTVDATCEDEGLITYTATFTKNWAKEQVMTEPVSATGHDWVDAKVVYTWNEEKTECTATRICNRDPSHTETVNATVVITTEVATCYKEGLKTCTATFTVEWAKEQIETVVIEKTDHMYLFTASLEGQNPTCTEPGYCTEVKVCGYCLGYYDETRIDLPATGHAWNNGKITRYPTCSTPGEKLYTCMNDTSHTRTEEISIDPDAHSWDEGVVNKEPACTEKGELKKTCNLCGTTVIEEIKANGHIAGKEVHENEVFGTCLEEGSYEKVCYCTVCGAEVSRTYDGVHPSLGGHKWDNSYYDEVEHPYGWRVTVEPTYDSQGEEKRYCANYPFCGCTEAQTRVIPALSDSVPPTVSITTDLVDVDHNDGMTDYTSDPDIVVNITAEDGENGSGIKQIEYTITKDGEVYLSGIYDEADKPVLTEEGEYIITATATDNNDNSSEPESIDTLIIDRTQPVIDPDRTEKYTVNEGIFEYCVPEKGSVTFTVTEANIESITVTNGEGEETADDESVILDAGDTYTITVIDKAGNTTTVTAVVYAEHSYDEGVVTTPATCLNTGIKTYTCERCGHQYTEEIAATGHTLTQVAAQAPTCTEIGWNAYEYCSKCDYTTKVEIPAHGHTAGDAVIENEREMAYDEATGDITDGGYDTVVYCTVCKIELERERTTFHPIAYNLQQKILYTVDTFQKGLDDAETGERIIMNDCATVDGMQVTDTRTVYLDLNGFVLTVDGSISMNLYAHVVDFSEGDRGRLIVDEGQKINERNRELSIWDDAIGGYYFIDNEVIMQQLKPVISSDGSSVTLTFRPIITDRATTESFFSDGAYGTADALQERIKIGVVFDVIDANGNKYEDIKWICADTLVQICYN
ncbi:MAG: hypothetical protein IKT46_07990, partial [Clostridia bacterium]|nr:hypothetical protein [Clostridia bacterium]